MAKRNSIQDMKEEIAGYRHLLHENPQTAYEEEFASDLVAEKLTEWGIPFKRGYGVTGIVATIEGQKNDSGRAIGLRADMDALDIEEQSGQPWTSKNPGKMHGCGHDGHTSILLGAARYLNDTKNFNGKVHLIFQPAEEGENGANAMIKDGLFKDFPCDEVYGLHNWPWMPVGTFATRHGPLLAAVDDFKIEITALGGHAAMPHCTRDPVVIAAKIADALQVIVSREIDPVDMAVLTITNMHAGTGAFNVIADSATLGGTVRSFKPETREYIEKRMGEIVDMTAKAFGGTARLTYQYCNDATINHNRQTDFALSVAKNVFGEENVQTDIPPCMGGEDFGALLREVPGCFVFVGQGTGENKSPHDQGLHSPFYDFNDEMIPFGVEFFAEIIEAGLPLNKA